MKDKGFTIKLGIYKKIALLPNELLGRLFRLCFLYNENPSVEIDESLQGLFALFKDSFDHQNDVRNKRASAGRKGGGNPNFEKGKSNPYKQNDVSDKQNKETDKQNTKSDKQNEGFDKQNSALDKQNVIEFEPTESDKQNRCFDKQNGEIDKQNGGSDKQNVESVESSTDQIYINNIEKDNIDSKDSTKGKEGKKKTKEEVLQDTERRKMVFYNSLIPFLDRYPKEMLREFFDYWTEMNKSKSKMRFEQENSWETPKRLAKWDKNQKTRRYGANKFERATEAEQQLISSVAESSIRKLEQECNGESGFVPLPI